KELRLARCLEERHIEASGPGEVVQIDAFYIGKLKGVGKVWQYTACDAYGSFALARVAAGEGSATGGAAFLRVTGYDTSPTNGHETVTTSGYEDPPPLAISKGCSEAAAKECGCDQAAQSDCGKEQAKGGSGSRTHRGATTFAS